ncbi:hypothetical protein KJ819_02075 [Patescibacteria group bacterium]|nr:hypothetical protein [Patescibacteria group bacterium]MBU1500929.1 hypothetical protein [Patescibacteria group bacterium]MBU2080560.1 hypothetical protein [Patescibacteria group bacterium]MBU2124364.1 hypothetical protein [Patescibacteria group bacterium]MBU2194491.1 hypothetical protein [Patescibacteria group bacterium]
MDSINLAATGGFADIVTFIGNFLVLLIVAGAFFFFAIKVGRAAFITLVMSLYAGFALFTLFPYTKLITGDSVMTIFVANAIIFAVLTYFPYVLLRRISTSGSIHINTLLLSGLSLLAAGLLLAIGYHALGLSAAVPLTPSLAALFAPSSYFFWWMAAPLVGIFLTAR